MISRDVVAAEPAVQAFDETPRLKEYGFVVGDLHDLERAKALVQAMVADADAICDRVIKGILAIGQNPYISTVNINGAEVKFALEIPLFDDEELSNRLRKAFSESSNKPDKKVISQRVAEGLLAEASAAKFAVAGVEHHDDGTLLRIVLRDPKYVEAIIRHKQGLAPTEELGGLADLAQNLALQANALRKEASTEALGCEGINSGEKILAARSAAKETVEGALRGIIEQMTQLRQGEMSPFRDTPYQVLKSDVEYVNKNLVVRRGPLRGKTFVERPIVLDVINSQQIYDQLKTRLGEQTLQRVNFRKYIGYVHAEIIKQLRAEQGMPLAAILRDYNTTHYRDTLRVVFTDPTQVRQPSLLAKLLSLGRAKPTPLIAAPGERQRALPAPQSQLAVQPQQAAAPSQAHTNGPGGFALPT